jgi:predicted acetyltransferase
MREIIMDVRLADFNDYPNLKKLWWDSFDETETFLKSFFEVRTNPDRITLLENEKVLISALHMLPVHFHVFGTEIKGTNLVGAATNAKYRGSGHMASLLKGSLELMKNRGEVLCCLKPFLHSFYRKYGWESCCDIYRYTMDMNSAGQVGSDVRLIKSVIPADIEELNNLYEKCSPGIYLKRSLKDWAFFLWDLQRNNGFIYVTEKGYAICLFDEKYVKIIETLSSDESELRKILNRISIDYKDHSIELNTLTELHHDDAVVKKENSEFTMIRIVDLKALSGKIFFKNINLKEGTYEISDDAAPWNRGIYNVFENQGRLIIRETTDKAVFKCDISELSRGIFNKYSTVVFEGY